MKMSDVAVLQDALGPARTWEAGALARRLRKIRHVALDMDGTIYKGATLFRATNPFLGLLKQLGITYNFLTNNSSKSLSDYVVHLERMGIGATKEMVYTSLHATFEFLHEEMPEVRRLFVLGTQSMCQEVSEAGFTLTENSAEDEPEAVLVGFDSALDFSRLCRAAWWIKQGKLFIASHPDRICPTDEPTVFVDCGSICAALTAATGRSPDAIPGKPDPRMLRGLLHRHGLNADQLAMVGDRLYTDMVMAREAGVLGVLVLTGEATATEASRHHPPLDLVVKDISQFGEHLRAAREGKET